MLCPKHKIPLQIKSNFIDIRGFERNVVMGKCPQCEQVYIGERLFPNSDSIMVDGNRYTYLAGLLQEEENKKLEEERRRNKEKKRLEKERKEEEEKRKAEAKEKKKAKKRKRETAEQRKREKEKQRIREKEKQLICSPAIIYTPKNVEFLNEYFFMNGTIFCERDKISLIRAKSIKIKYGEKTYITDGYYCETCGVTFTTRDDLQKHFEEQKQRVAERERKIREKEKQLEEQKQRVAEGEQAIREKEKQQAEVKQRRGEKEKRRTEEDNKIEAGRQETLYICKGTIACLRRGHTIESATAVIGTLREDDIKINCNYCKQCRKYFINYNEYVHYRNKYGIIMGNFKITHGNSFSDEFGVREEQSLLNLCGYTVNQTDDLTPRERQAILSYLMRNQIISKHEIMSHLQMLINTNGKRPQMRVAKERWNEDLDYVRNYRIGQQEHVPIKNIKKWHG